jgi:hypothetical protein
MQQQHKESTQQQLQQQQHHHAQEIRSLQQKLEHAAATAASLSMEVAESRAQATEMDVKVSQALRFLDCAPSNALEIIRRRHKRTSPPHRTRAGRRLQPKRSCRCPLPAIARCLVTADTCRLRALLVMLIESNQAVKLELQQLQLSQQELSDLKAAAAAAESDASCEKDRRVRPCVARAREKSISRRPSNRS